VSDTTMLRTTSTCTVHQLLLLLLHQLAGGGPGIQGSSQPCRLIALRSSERQAPVAA
jgi:hypothetical protein